MQTLKCRPQKHRPWDIKCGAWKALTFRTKWKSKWKRTKHWICCNMITKNSITWCANCVSWKQFSSADWLFMVYFAVNVQTKAEKPLLSYHFPQLLVLSYIWIPMCCVTLSEFFLGETIADTVNLQMIIYHFSQSWVSFMLSKQVSSISLCIVSKWRRTWEVCKILVLCDTIWVVFKVRQSVTLSICQW